MFSKKILWTTAGCLLFIGLMSCTTSQSVITPKIDPMPQEAGSVIKAQNNFAFKTFKRVSQADQSNKNKLISPLSIYMDLSMVYNGADEETKEGMEKALQLEGISLPDLNKTNAAILNNFPIIDSSVNIDIANAIWYREILDPLNSFLDINKKYYKAHIQGAPFDPSTVKDINDWVSQKTHKKIKKIIESIKPDDIMFLLNAVYFKGDWTQEFDPKLTKDRTFYTKDGEQQVPFMYNKSSFNFSANDDLQIVELPYGKEHYSMYILLPKSKTGVQSLISSLDQASFDALKNNMHKTTLKLHVPKWESSYKIEDLSPVLSQLGMEIAFTDHADFSKMYENHQTKISQVKHKTYIKVDEKGTEAAAVTSTGMQTTSVGINIPEMDINHPFVYLITEKDTGSILFLGEVNNPSK